MSVSLRILFVSAEAAPYAKVGGLADVAGSLPQALAELGHDVRLALPLHGTIDRARWAIAGPVRTLEVPFGTRSASVAVHEAERADVRVLFYDNPELLGRGKVYGEPDDARRFALFCRAVCEDAAGGEWRPDLVHAHDWHTALIPQLLKQAFVAQLPNTGSVFTIHNLAYQGTTKEHVLRLVGLKEDRLLIEKKRFGKQIDPLARGIAFADAVSTVSERYAEEILTPEFGEGLAELLEERHSDLYGIVNGIDVGLFDPSTDKSLVANYGVDDLEGKALCKESLQEESGLAVDARAPLCGVIGRLVEQKGIDILTPVAPEILRTGAQIVVLGTGEPSYEATWRELAARHRGNLSLTLRFDAALAQRIYAGSDMFLMPSRFEPCGLGQLISFRYGTVPVVHAVGGLADTVRDADAERRSGTGFSFREYAAAPLADAVRRALRAYRDEVRWDALRERVMRLDHSWNASAERYVEMYEAAREAKRAA